MFGNQQWQAEAAYASFCVLHFVGYVTHVKLYHVIDHACYIWLYVHMYVSICLLAVYPYRPGNCYHNKLQDVL